MFIIVIISEHNCSHFTWIVCLPWFACKIRRCIRSWFKTHWHLLIVVNLFRRGKWNIVHYFQIITLNYFWVLSYVKRHIPDICFLFSTSRVFMLFSKLSTFLFAIFCPTTACSFIRRLNTAYNVVASCSLSLNIFTKSAWNATEAASNKYLLLLLCKEDFFPTASFLYIDSSVWDSKRSVQEFKLTDLYVICFKQCTEKHLLYLPAILLTP